MIREGQDKLKGLPVDDPTTATVLRGSKVRGGGLALLEDIQLIETLAHFPRERIPERTVHAKAAGAWGEFEVTHDITSTTSLNTIGKKTKVLMRISTAAGEKGSSDTVRDARGWAMKFFAEEGNYDIVGNDLPLFGPRGVPASLRHIAGYGLKEGDAIRPAGEEPDYHVKDLYNAIERGDYPSWTIYLQIMNPKEAETYRWNIFDSAKIWPHKDFPLVLVWKPYDVEQAALSPSTMVPGIGLSTDIMLQARMFSCPDAARYRVGPNYQQLPCNRAKYVYSPYQRDGPVRIEGNYGGDPDYGKSTRTGPVDVSHDKWVGQVSAWTSMLWKFFLEEGEDKTFIHNLTEHLKKALPEAQMETINKPILSPFLLRMYSSC
ncbi:heme-dependent catalase [Lindgomyces ingoldianus]|uniref:Heme-dependent catalase n=1 Tax=Lindgomyces ingoldianus TaxID=673940 RepID=A0ACB6QP25_9PLEO|nr:heme-dependent catalase [Lindgomyces ingoldianus]KAF2468723.1 heme-dependent catalase [Lindgomyces ingoldianus]